MIARGGSAVAEYSLGIEIEGGRIISLLEKGSPLPARVRRLFTTVSDRQAAIDVNILAGKTSRYVPVGRLLLSGVSCSRRGDPCIEIAMIVDRDGLVRVRARDLDTGATQIAAFPLEPDPAQGSAELKGRIFSLIARVREESRALPPGHTALLSEIREVTNAGFISVGGGDVDGMTGCITVLETILGEIIARTRGQESGRPEAGSPKSHWGASSRGPGFQERHSSTLHEARHG